jgi:phage repressor protein C with HTH and peptisase S24 domain
MYLARTPDGGAAVKRVILNIYIEAGAAGRRLILLSDNPGYEPFEMGLDPDRPLSYYIIGRVRWAGKEFE